MENPSDWLRPGLNHQHKGYPMDKGFYHRHNFGKPGPRREQKGKGKGKRYGRQGHWNDKGNGKGSEKGDIPLNERRGARVEIGPPRTDPVPWDNLIRRGGSDSDWSLYIERSRSRGCSDADTEWIRSRGEIKTAHSMHKLRKYVTFMSNLLTL